MREPSSPERRVLSRRASAVAAAVVLAVEVVIATVLRDVSWVRNELGDVLAVMGVFFVFTAALPDPWRRRSAGVAAAAVAVGLAVEAAQWARLGDLLGLAPGSLAAIVLGSTASAVDVLMYALGGVLAWAASRGLARVRRREAITITT
ncbi:DUF2809 domain-containing protein [Actinotalea sp. M2MS4P-6]|uniref:DUF2809 domain-containing protein n=1 Tax=Actinotalea sp. M2MS4P-6 TaxID=2983762 RepID=UPI0021E3A491|nr:DUF2809 domain-containing protein [Actinotalea sp. M2MS4P-6]MCV2395647.1 DUF2809 domain-containing protein [Actinotalea sp. M2MS4P-6]